LGARLDLACRTVNGRTLGENIARAQVWNEDVIRSDADPIQPEGGLAVLTGNLAPNGAIIKPPAMEERLMRHRGPAIVFRDYNDMSARIDDESLPATPDSVLVLQNGGPRGGPGMPEWGQLPIPRKLLKAGIRDMVRISDARMSGTSYGACVLHVSPESYVGGPLGLVHDGDMIELDVPGRRLHLDISGDEMERRRAAWRAPPRRYERSYGVLFADHVSQADRGCDFDFLSGTAKVAEPEIH
jgi:dihydroxy-acid dehydratase